MEQTDRVRELEIMKEIAETINRANELGCSLRHYGEDGEDACQQYSG